MFKLLKRLLDKPAADAIATSELADARRQLLAQQAAAEYHAKLAEYYATKIARLTRYTSANPTAIAPRG